MSAPALTFPLGPGHAELEGDVLRLRHPQRPGLDYALLDPSADEIVLAGRSLRWRRQSRSIDADEIEARYALHDPAEVGHSRDEDGRDEHSRGEDGRAEDGDSLEFVVRHTFAVGWTQRYVLINHSDRACVVDDLAVGLQPGADASGWTLTAGAEAFWLTGPPDGAGPVLAATLQSGEVSGYAGGGWRTGPLRLAAGARYVVSWRADWHSGAAAFERQRPTVLPRRTEFDVNVPAEIPGADTAVVAGDDVGVTREGDISLVLPDRAGRYRIELRSATGTVVLALSWAEPLPDRVAACSRRWLDPALNPRGPNAAGIARLASSAAGLVVQRAVADRLLDQPDPGIEAVELLASRLLADGAPTAVDIAFLAGEALRTGDPDCADVARVGLLAQAEASPGLGLAATRVGLADIAAGRSVAELTDLLRQLAGTTRGPAGGRAGEVSLADVVARVELAVLTQQRDGGSDSIRDAVRVVGVRVGLGLPGVSMRPDPLTEIAYAAAVLGLLPETGAETDPAWLDSPRAVADQLRRRCLADLADRAASRDRTAEHRAAEDEEVAVSLGWLVLGQPLS